MQIEILAQPLAQLETEALVVVVADQLPKLSGALADLDRATAGLLGELSSGADFTAKALETTLIHRPAGIKAKRLLLAGTGPSLDVLGLWRVAGACARVLKGKGVHHMAFVLPEGIETEAGARAVITGVASGNFDPDTYKSDRKTDRLLERLSLVVAPAAKTAALTRAVEQAAIIARAQQFTRDLANEPSNRLTPTMMGERAEAMARQAGLECELIDANRARELKMGAFLSVAQGSAEPPVMIVLRYNGAPAGGPLLGLIGKGITFDSGGISIKPAAGMELMKFDMCGGAATLGAMQAIAALKLKINVLAIVPCSENMPGGKAQKPGDVQIAMNRKSIEVLNTDAEGRLVLADALCYARELGATHLVDSATLTGAIVVALAHVNAGVFANNDEFHNQFQRALARSGEKMWRMPLDSEYLELIKGTVGDIINTGGRYGGAVTAAKFLQEFVGDTPWIHLDIAGTAWTEENKAWMPKGPTGSPTYTLIELARVMAGE